MVEEEKSTAVPPSECPSESAKELIPSDSITTSVEMVVEQVTEMTSSATTKEQEEEAKNAEEEKGQEEPQLAAEKTLIQPPEAMAEQKPREGIELTRMENRCAVEEVEQIETTSSTAGNPIESTAEESSTLPMSLSTADGETEATSTSPSPPPPVNKLAQRRGSAVTTTSTVKPVMRQRRGSDLTDKVAMFNKKFTV